MNSLPEIINNLVETKFSLLTKKKKKKVKMQENKLFSKLNFLRLENMINIFMYTVYFINIIVLDDTASLI